MSCGGNGGSGHSLQTLNSKKASVPYGTNALLRGTTQVDTQKVCPLCALYRARPAEPTSGTPRVRSAAPGGCPATSASGLAPVSGSLRAARSRAVPFTAQYGYHPPLYPISGICKWVCAPLNVDFTFIKHNRPPHAISRFPCEQHSLSTWFLEKQRCGIKNG